MKISVRKAGKLLLTGLLGMLLGSLLTACSLSKKAEETRWLVLATTPDLNNSGLLDTLLPPFEKANNLRVKRLPVSYKKALEYARDGGVDVLLVEENSGEDLFKLAGAPPEIFPFKPELNADPLAAPTPVPLPTATPSFDNILTERKLAFWSDLVLVGPADDRGHVGEQYDAGRAFKWVALYNLPFLVAGDAPGLREQQDRIWRQVGRGNESDRGTGFRVFPGDAAATLQEAEAKNAYTVVPRYVYSNNERSGKLRIILQKDFAFFLGYEISIPNVIRIKDRDVSSSRLLVHYLTNNSTQTTISKFRQANSSDDLFRPQAFRVFRPT